MTDQEKIEVIKERHDRRKENGQRHAIFQGNAANDIQFLLSELEHRDETINRIQGKLADASKELIVLKEKNRRMHTLYDENFARSCEYAGQLQSAQQEIEHLNRLLTRGGEGIEQLQQREQKLIEGLRWYADGSNYRSDAGDKPAVMYDIGEYAARLLDEIGVTVE